MEYSFSSENRSISHSMVLGQRTEGFLGFVLGNGLMAWLAVSSTTAEHILMGYPLRAENWVRSFGYCP